MHYSTNCLLHSSQCGLFEIGEPLRLRRTNKATSATSVATATWACKRPWHRAERIRQRLAAEEPEVRALAADASTSEAETSAPAADTSASWLHTLASWLQTSASWPHTSASSWASGRLRAETASWWIRLEAHGSAHTLSSLGLSSSRFKCCGCKTTIV